MLSNAGQCYVYESSVGITKHPLQLNDVLKLLMIHWLSLRHVDRMHDAQSSYSFVNTLSIFTSGNITWLLYHVETSWEQQLCWYGASHSITIMSLNHKKISFKYF